jgi:MFS family permease
MDLSGEMVTSVLPVYLVLHLQYSPMVFGALDGLYHGGTSLARLIGGVLGDRWQRHRDVAAAGYAASAVSRILFLLVGRSIPGIVGALAVDRVGKGLRTPSRDALISLTTPNAHLASAFGVHRTMDATGAMLGPLATFALLAWLPRAYDVVFVVSFAVGLIGVAVLLAFVRNYSPPVPEGTQARPTIASLLRDRTHRGLVLAAALLGLMTVGDGLLYLALQRRLQFAESFVPLLFVATPAVYLLLAIPLGRLADRIGKTRVVLLGYTLLLLSYLVALFGTSVPVTVAVAVLCLGAYYAATDGVLMALASLGLPAPVRATGLSLVTTANSAAQLGAGVGFGWLWTRSSLESALATYAAGLLFVLLTVAPLLRASKFPREARATT